MEEYRRIVLTGFSGTGKSTVARLLADQLGWTAVDLDADLERSFGMTIPEVFASQGEPAFREAEREALAATLRQDRVVIATGGGAAASDDAWSDDLLRSPGTLVVTLDADPATSISRLEVQQQREGGATARPMLAGDDPLGRAAGLKAGRQAFYDRADITLIVDRVSAEEVAAEIATLVAPAGDGATTITLSTPTVDSSITVWPGVTGDLGRVARERWPQGQRAWVVTDTNVGPHHLDRVTSTLEAAGWEVRSRSVAPGEGSKSLAGVGQLYDWALGGGIERSDIVVALGGGVIGDLAGYFAASVLRGVGLVQVPTSLLAMVDSSVGGKTGINHAAGKNLVGAFYQPPRVLVDPYFLQTLPSRELRQGWAEIIKHGVIQPSTPGGERSDLLRFLERNADNLLGLREPAISYLVRRNVALKAAVVQADERESGIRAYLNFGHTLGHAIEASDYQHLHGEAVALGMRGAMRIGHATGTVDAEAVEQVDRLLDRYGLPATFEGDIDRILALTASDKKKSAGKLRWVLPLAGGGVILRDDVPSDLPRQALESLAKVHHG